MIASAIACNGLQAATSRFDASAQRTARWTPQSDVDLATETVEQIGAKHAFSANLSVIKTADEMTGTLLDMIA